MRRSAWTFALALCVSTTGVRAAELIRQPLVSPRDAWERQLLDDAVDGKCDSLSSLRAALIASGIDQPHLLASHEQRIESLAKGLAVEAKERGASARDRALAVLTTLHRDVLHGPFDDDCDSMAATLETGRYNCVTATLLFVELAQQLHLPCTILHAPGHVRVRIDDRTPFEIEPTCAGCFAEGKLLAWKSQPRQISPLALAGKLYYNRGVEALRRRDHAAAIGAFDRSLWLDAEDAQARQNLLAALNNGALTLTERQEFASAKALLEQAASLDPSYPPLATNNLHLHGRWVIALCERSEHAAAIRLIDDLALRYPQAELARNGRAVVYRLWIDELVLRGETHAALSRVDEGLTHAPHDRQLHERRSQLLKARS
jgi:hypothetical protein